MAHLMHDLASWFKLDEIDIDNWMFKLYYKFRDQYFVKCWVLRVEDLAAWGKNLKMKILEKKKKKEENGM